MTEPRLLILISLLSGPKHGYAIQVDVKAISGGWMGPGTLYGALVRLEREGFIRALPTMDRRRPYELTSTGRQLIDAELSKARHILTLADQRSAR
jgi:DNA-binding PadR family transcriptional regulator